MQIALAIVAFAAVVLAVTAACGRWGVSAPLILIAVGIGGSFLPFLPEIHLDPDLVLLGFLPPLLYAAALQTSLVDFNANRRAILLLSIGLIIFTTAWVGVLVHTLLPVGWPVAFAIGAVVAPPDAVAATAIGRRIGLPRRIVTVLEGESLLNDATALVSLRMAIAAMSGTVGILDIGRDFLIAAGGGVLVGLVFYLLVGWLRKQLTDQLIDTALSMVTPFAAYLAAETIHASGVIAVVIAGLLLGHRAPVLQTAQSRIADRMNWRTVAFVLEHTVFLLIGLQARWIVDDVRASSIPLGRIVLICLATLVAVMVLRLAWVFAGRYLLVRPGSGASPPSAPYTAVLGWAGMRGVVTLAAAFVIPGDTPYREVLLLIAFTVVAGTLLVQGFSLPWLARRLGVPSPDPREDALARAALLQQASEVGLTRLAELETDPEISHMIRRRMEERTFAAWERLGADPDRVTPSQAYGQARLEMIEAEREEVLRVRSSGQVDSVVIAGVLGMLDLEESMIDRATHPGSGPAKEVRMELGPWCEHLTDAAPDAPATQEDGCEECLQEGTTWVHLRRCTACGHVGCCDSSPGRHATGHFESTGHPVMRSAEAGEEWRWCYVDSLVG